MKIRLVCLSAIFVFGPIAKAQEAASITHINFDDVATGTLPKNWRVEGTNLQGAPALWNVLENPAAKSPPKVLALTEIAKNSRGHFNIAWTPDPQFRNGELEVSVYADTGRVDQGGGPIWRVQDASNYYVARYNPLENNFRIYYVKDGSRKELASVEDLAIPAGQWFTIRIIHQGSHIEGWINGEKLLEVDDDTIDEAGGIGVWTKDDAASFFDDLNLTPG